MGCERCVTVAGPVLGRQLGLRSHAPGEPLTPGEQHTSATHYLVHTSELTHTSTYCTVYLLDNVQFNPVTRQGCAVATTAPTYTLQLSFPSYLEDE